MVQSVKNPPAKQEIQVQSLGQEPVSLFLLGIPWTEEPGELQSMESQVRHDAVTKPSPPPQ